jgi:hypothetical protein
MFARWSIADARDRTPNLSKSFPRLTRAQCRFTISSVQWQARAARRFRTPFAVTSCRSCCASRRSVRGGLRRSNGVTLMGLQDVHSQMRTLGRVYAKDDSTLETFLESVWKQLLTQSAKISYIPTRVGLGRGAR